MEYRDYQLDIIDQGVDILGEFGLLYLAMEVRTGKTLTSMGIAEGMNVKSVLFLTKKKAIGSIKSDYDLLKPSFDIEVINYESLHKVEGVYDLIVLDEAHCMGGYPKPSKRSKQVKQLVSKNDPLIILMSGTPTPESYSQMYHQVYVSPRNPFSKYKNFYRFCDSYVDVFTKTINGLLINDYSKGRKDVLIKMKPYTIRYTQKEAGFKVKTTEKVLYVEMEKTTYSLAKSLSKNLVVEGKDEVILADTPVKLMMKLHQIYSGTVKFESGKAQVLDHSKARFIRSKFANVKIGIFYKFKAELKALKSAYGDDLTTDLEEFNETDKSIALQIISGREGISLRKARYLVYYNIDFSATSYWQSKDRMTTKERLKNDVYWIFAKRGIEDGIYKTVLNKKDYTLNHFRKDLLILQS